MHTIFLLFVGIKNVGDFYCLCHLLQDALRLYIINSPVVRAEPLRFKKDGVYGVVSIA